jgi:hypothetical protein
MGDIVPSHGMYNPKAYQLTYILTSLMELDGDDFVVRHERRQPDEEWDDEGSSRMIPKETNAFLLYSRFCDGQLAAMARNKDKLLNKKLREEERRQAARLAELKLQEKAAAEDSDVVMGGMD